MKLKLLVLRCVDIELSRAFYEKLGLHFSKEQHGTGPIHYAAVRDGMVIELYPAKPGYRDDTRLGFVVSEYQARIDELAVNEEFKVANSNIIVITDPDGRKIELYNEGL